MALARARPRPRRAHRAAAVLHLGSAQRPRQRPPLGSAASGVGVGAPRPRSRTAETSASSWSGSSRAGRTTRSGRTRRGSRPAPRRAIRNRPLSSSIGSRRSVPIESKSTGTPAAPAAIARRPAEGRHEPEVVEDHRPDVEDERLRRVEGLLDHRDELADLGAGLRRVAGRPAARRSGPGGRCWSGSGPGRRASPGRCRGGGPPGRRGSSATPPATPAVSRSAPAPASRCPRPASARGGTADAPSSHARAPRGSPASASR